MKKVYSKAFKAKMVQKMAIPGGISGYALAAETGVAQSTLSRWLHETHSVEGMSETKSWKTKKKPRTSMEKLRLVVEASELSGAEFGAFLRREGVHEADLEEWRTAAAEALGPAKKRARAKQAKSETKRIRHLERDLRRKEKALAEVSALLILKKKVDALWGDEDDDTDERSEK